MHACLTISPPLLPLNKEGGRLFTQTALCRVLSRLTSTIDNRTYYLCLYSALVMAAQTIASILGTSTEHGSGDLQHGLSVGEQPVQRVLLPGTPYRANASTLVQLTHARALMSSSRPYIARARYSYARDAYVS